jgi:hypothetical protein
MHEFQKPPHHNYPLNLQPPTTNPAGQRPAKLYWHQILSRPT